MDRYEYLDAKTREVSAMGQTRAFCLLLKRSDAVCINLRCSGGMPPSQDITQLKKWRGIDVEVGDEQQTSSYLVNRQTGERTQL